MLHNEIHLNQEELFSKLSEFVTETDMTLLLCPVCHKFFNVADGKCRCGHEIDKDVIYRKFDDGYLGYQEPQIYMPCAPFVDYIIDNIPYDRIHNIMKKNGCQWYITQNEKRCPTPDEIQRHVEDMFDGFAKSGDLMRRSGGFTIEKLSNNRFNVKFSLV